MTGRNIICLNPTGVWIESQGRNKAWDRLYTRARNLIPQPAERACYLIPFRALNAVIMHIQVNPMNTEMKIEAGNPTIDWTGINPGFNEKKIVLVESGEEKYIGMVYEEIVRIKISGQAGLRRSQVIKSNQLGNRNAATEVFRDTFHPHSHLDITEDYSLTLRYQDDVVVGEKMFSSGEIQKINTDLPANIFDAHAAEMVLRLLPYQKIDSATLPVFHGTKNQTIDIEVKVRGKETYQSPAIKTGAWVIHTVWGESEQMYWISEEERLILKQSTVMDENTRLEFIRVE